ncbi:hypothetical protein [Kitasatospora sp. NPDC058046]|uniref:type I-G CRISPR-associated protein, Cas3-extension family n=1 Tax=Kitasatospora sp. NPDC058046 TaxID=3346312 RepID=UPI0036DE71E0
MHQLDLPALQAADPLGMLAALGILQLTHTDLDNPSLHWSGPTGHAILTTNRHLDHDTLATILGTYLPPPGAADPLPQAPEILTEHPHTTNHNDALREPIDHVHQHVHTAATAQRANPHDQRADYYTSFINQLAYDENTPDHPTQLTLHYAPCGQMTLARTWTKTVEACLNDPDQLRTALTGWIRQPGYAGANLDQRDLGDSHLNTTGHPRRQAAPGPNWYALHSLPLLRTTGPLHHPAATLHTGQNDALRWPIWHQPLTRAAVVTLIEHPAVQTSHPSTETLTNLGVTAIYTAHRVRRTNARGPLAAGHLTWP